MARRTGVFVVAALLLTMSASAQEPQPPAPAAAATEAPKAETGDAAASPQGYSRGENQKPISKAYKENWKAIFERKQAKKPTNKR